MYLVLYHPSRRILTFEHLVTREFRVNWLVKNYLNLYLDVELSVTVGVTSWG